MTKEEIIGFVESFTGILILKPEPGDGFPELAWGDAFFYYSPDGTVPTTVQPFVTIVTKNYPDDETSRLDRPDTFRVNIAAGKEEFARWTADGPGDPAATDTVIAHPVYGSAGWLAVVNPGPRTAETTLDLVRKAYDLARGRWNRRAGRNLGEDVDSGEARSSS